MKKDDIKKWLDEFKRHTGKDAIFHNKKKTIDIPFRYLDEFETYPLHDGINRIKVICGFI